MLTDDIRPFISHLGEMTKNGVKAVISKYNYACTNKGDMTLLIGWLELLVILHRVDLDVSQRQDILDLVQRAEVGSISIPPIGLEIDKNEGFVLYKGVRYEFTPVFRATHGLLKSNQ